MPVYEYRCEACDARFEKYVRSWNEPVRCPRCAGEVEKQISSFAVAGAGGARSGASPGAGACCGGGGCGCRH